MPELKLQSDRRFLYSVLNSYLAFQIKTISYGGTGAFLLDIIQTGQVIVPEKLIDFDSQSSDRSAILLQDYHKTDALHLPGSAPDFHTNAASWAARYIFSTIQLVLLRDSGEDQINRLTGPLRRQKVCRGIYSADVLLCDDYHQIPKIGYCKSSCLFLVYS